MLTKIQRARRLDEDFYTPDSSPELSRGIFEEQLFEVKEQKQKDYAVKISRLPLIDEF